MTFRHPGRGAEHCGGSRSMSRTGAADADGLERAAGIAVRVISAAQFAESGLTRAVLRGGRYIGVLGIGDLAAQVCAAVAEGGLCYGYHADLDLLGHLYGPGSQPWRMQLRQVDRLVESIMVACRRARCWPWWLIMAWWLPARRSTSSRIRFCRKGFR